jgi:hypothetical protein
VKDFLRRPFEDQSAQKPGEKSQEEGETSRRKKKLLK